MVSLEDEMKQKDKEAAVLKANHKYEMLLNIELERIEKCRRTYESFHNFEVAVMKTRQNRIAQKQQELKVQPFLKSENTDLQQRCRQRKSTTRINSQNSSNNRMEWTLVQAAKADDKIKKTTSHVQLNNDPNYNTLMSLSSAGNLHSNPRRVQYANATAQYDNYLGARFTPITRISSTQNSESEKPKMKNTFLGNDKHVKFPVLRSVFDSGKNPTNEYGSHTPAHTIPYHSCSNTTGRLRDVRTPSTSCAKKKLHHTAAKQDNLTSFDEYRLRLQESERRQRKPKHHLTRAISAMESTACRSMEDAILILPRARSADAQ